ncbi:Hypothetical predicted protein [Pelobates cultripes]|uniref:Uncharacterized protein n=1 Tax=Pelobates cultripes TaxID=61616 RepID=A0AAD1WHX0_PELCU|nr:Hypothetical predicted protein [Pelobates cultripes]
MLTIDRLPRQLSSLHQPRGYNTGPMYIDHIKSLRYKLRKQVCSEQQSLCPGQNPSLQHDLQILVTSLLKQDQGEQNLSKHEQDVFPLSLSLMEMKAKDQESHLSAAFQPQHGRLLKAGLKPLRPVSIQGPTVTLCQGMLPGMLQCPVDRNTLLLHRPTILY